jgi:hypothetical protein
VRASSSNHDPIKSSRTTRVLLGETNRGNGRCGSARVVRFRFPRAGGLGVGPPLTEPCLGASPVTLQHCQTRLCSNLQTRRAGSSAIEHTLDQGAVSHEQAAAPLVVALIALIMACISISIME